MNTTLPTTQTQAAVNDNPMLLTAKAGNWRVFHGRMQDQAFAPIMQQVFERDDYTCRFCDFQARNYQQVINQDQNYRNNRLNNLLTACCFCAQCFFIESVGADGISGGQIIYAPDISQAVLNSFCHSLFCAMDGDAAYQETAQNLYRSLRLRSQLVENKFGSGMSDPRSFGQLLLEFEATYRKPLQTHLLQPLRLLPSKNKFQTQLDAWSRAAQAIQLDS